MYTYATVSCGFVLFLVCQCIPFGGAGMVGRWPSEVVGPCRHAAVMQLRSSHLAPRSQWSMIMPTSLVQHTPLHCAALRSTSDRWTERWTDREIEIQREDRSTERDRQTKTETETETERERERERDLDCWTWFSVSRLLEPVLGTTVHIDFEFAIQNANFLRPEGNT